MKLKPTLQFGSFTKLNEWKNLQRLTEAADSQSDASLDEIKEDVERAIALLMGRFPFFGAFIYKFRILYVPANDPDIQTMATDGANIYINPAFAASLTDAQTVFVLCHEILHNVMLHFTRQKAKGANDHERWNVAADYEINPMLVDEGLLTADELTNTLHGLYDVKYLDMPAEEIYDKENKSMPQLPPNILDKMKKSTKDFPQGGTPPPPPPTKPGGSPQPGSGSGKPGEGPGAPGEGPGTPGSGTPGNGAPGSGAGGTEDENGTETAYAKGNGVGGILDPDKGVEKQKELGVEVKTASDTDADKMVSEALGEVKKLKGGNGRGTGKGLLQRALERLSKPQVNWKNELRRIIGKMTSGSEDYFGKKKHLYRGEYFYGDRDADDDRLRDAIMAVDVSGSIGDDALKAMLSEVAGIIKAKKIKKTEVVYFDDGISGTDTVKHPPVFDWTKAKGGGGTSFIDPMDLIYSKWKKGKVEIAVFITDGYGDQNGSTFQGKMKDYKKLNKIFIWLVIDNPGWEAPGFGRVIHMTASK